MAKLHQNAKRVIMNGNPYIEHTDPVTGKIRFERDVEGELAKLPVNLRLKAAKSTKTRVARRGELA